MDRLTWRVQDTFKNLEWRGKDICEIGCGRGDIAFYMALNGARTVVGLEPSAAGSSSERDDVLWERLATIRVGNLRILRARLEEFEFEQESFDLVFGIQVIEHIHETSKPLRDAPVALGAYQRAFARMNAMLRPGGRLVLTGCSGHAVWPVLARLGVRPLLPGLSGICWKIHRPPGTYRRLALEAGFPHVELRWRVPYPLRFFPILADNPLFQYFTWASYILTAQKP